MGISINFAEGEHNILYPKILLMNSRNNKLVKPTIESKLGADYLLGNLIDMIKSCEYSTGKLWFIKKDSSYKHIAESDEALFSYLEDFLQYSTADKMRIDQLIGFLDSCCDGEQYATLKQFELYMSLLGERICYPQVNLIPKAVGIPEASVGMLKDFDKLKELYMEHYEYICNSLAEILETLVYHLLRNKFHIAKCEHCGLWFSRCHPNERYCNRQSPVYAQHSCKDAIKLINKKEGEVNDDSKRIYKNLTNSIMNRIRTCVKPERIPALEEELVRVRTEAAKFKKKIKAGEATTEEFIEWMESCRVRQKKFDDEGE